MRTLRNHTAGSRSNNLSRCRILLSWLPWLQRSCVIQTVISLLTVTKSDVEALTTLLCLQRETSELGHALREKDGGEVPLRWLPWRRLGIVGAPDQKSVHKSSVKATARLPSGSGGAQKAAVTGFYFEGSKNKRMHEKRACVRDTRL